ncbi:MAG: murein L,D-transpeptidase [Hyphomicrobiaceae bacterium]|nr:murein L,D-transpeptidase [Hyphomicrobiaceae bacterium]
MTALPRRSALRQTSSWPHQPRSYLRVAATTLCVTGSAILALTSAAQAVSIELKDVASDRIERQRAAAEGSLPLPGTPDLARLNDRLAEKGLKLGSPILLRAFKSESEFEVWIRKDDTFVLFATYPVCHWSGTLGPKLTEGDKQTPEGFYTVTRHQIRHIGRWPRSLNLGFPNAYDRSLARTGSHILVHGGCSSVGCFAMTNSVMEEIYHITEQALGGGQIHLPVHVYPFRMTEANLASQKASPWFEFWTNLKEGSDLFEATRRPPRVATCDGRYRFTDSALEEGASGSPLAVCGETLAALETLGRLSPSAQAQISLLANPPVVSVRSLPQHRPRHLRAAILSARAAARQPVQPLLPEAATAMLPIPAPCSMQRASCRKFMASSANRAKVAAAAQNRRVRQASRSQSVR